MNAAPGAGANPRRPAPTNATPGMSSSQLERGKDESGDPRLNTQVIEQLKKIYEHRTYFTYFVSFVQIVVMVISVLVFSLAPISFGTSTSTGTVTGRDGSVLTTSYSQPGNFWIASVPVILSYWQRSFLRVCEATLG